MPLTPSDVEKTTFSTALRGYDLDEVDDFLDQVVVAIRDLQDEVASAKAKASDLEKNGVGSTEVAAPATDETAVGRALVAAQEAADKILEDAEGEAKAIVEAASTEAETFETERQERREEAEAEMAEHTSRIADVRNQLAVLATQVADRLDEMDQAIEGRHETSAPHDSSGEAAPSEDLEEAFEANDDDSGDDVDGGDDSGDDDSGAASDFDESNPYDSSDSSSPDSNDADHGESRDNRGNYGDRF